MATHYSILAWRIACTEEPGRATVPSIPKEADTTEVTWHTCTAMRNPFTATESSTCLPQLEKAHVQ